MARTGIPKRIPDRDLSTVPRGEYLDMPQLLDVKSAAAFLGVSKSYLDKSRCEGTLKGRTPPPKFVRVENKVYYRLSTLTAWLDALEERVAI